MAAGRRSGTEPPLVRDVLYRVPGKGSMCLESDSKLHDLTCRKKQSQDKKPLQVRAAGAGPERGHRGRAGRERTQRFPRAQRGGPRAFSCAPSRGRQQQSQGGGSSSAGHAPARFITRPPAPGAAASPALHPDLGRAPVLAAPELRTHAHPLALTLTLTLTHTQPHLHCLSPRALTPIHVRSYSHTLSHSLVHSQVHFHPLTLTRSHPRSGPLTLRGAGTVRDSAERTHGFSMADLSFIEDSVAFPEKEEDEEEEEEGVEWGYEEGVEWGLVFPDANGEYQSPINLNSREARYDPSLLDVRLSPNYVVCRDCEVTNDGHTIQVILKSKSVLSGGPLPQGHEFELYEVRFHWGRENQRGSEHTVNFKAFPMELHLIHWNSTLFGSIDEAVGKPHGIAIIALFVQIGKEHVGLKAVTEILQDIQYKGKSKIIPCFNPNTLLPDPLLRDYWVYEGSLTIPPCSEGVTWILFRYPLTISQLQIEEFRRLRTHVKGAELVEGCDGILGDNFRPTQPLSDRVIRAAFQ